MKYLIPSSLLMLMSSLSLSANSPCEVAQMQSQDRQMSSDPCCPKPKPAPCCPVPKPCCPPRLDCCPPRCAQLVGGPKGEILPNAGPCVSCGADLYLTADFIYWMVREDHLAYVYSSGQQLTASPAAGHVFQPDFKMKPGFKVGLGMNFDHDGWDIFAQYTWIRAHGINGSASATATTVLFDDFWDAGFGGPDLITSASVSWQLNNFNVIDLELGRNFYVSRYLMLRPHFGLKGTWQKQHYNVTVNETITAAQTGVTVADLLTSNMFLTSKFWGIGIRAGLDTAWHFSRSFSLVGEFAISGLYGQFKEHRLSTSFDKTAGVFVASVAGLNPINTNDNFHTIKPVMEWMLGLRWEMYTCDNEYHFAFEAGWEEQYWLGQNQFFSFRNETQGGDLNFQGLTVKARFDF